MALWQLIERGETPHQAVVMVKKNLDLKGRTAILPKVARAFEKIAAREIRKRTMQLTVARIGDFEKALRGAKEALLEAGIREIDLVESIDESLVGGWRLEGHDTLIDNSWKKSLLTIYNRATQ